MTPTWDVSGPALRYDRKMLNEKIFIERIQVLTPARREIAMLTLQYLTKEEIAAIVGKPVKTVAWEMVRAARQLHAFDAQP